MAGADSTTQEIVRFVRSGATARIWVDRPESRNAISREVMTRLEQVLDEVEDDPPTVLAVRGAGQRAFVSGGDLKEFSAIRTGDAAVAMATRMRGILDRLASLPCLTVAELNGHALGGGAEFAVAADLRIAASNARIGFSQIRLAISPAWGGIERLTELVGRARALYLLCTGTPVEADRALDWGLVEEVIPTDLFETRADELAAQIADYPGEVVRFMKASVNEVQPSVHPATAGRSIEGFAASWTAETHWDAVAAADEERRRTPR
jgi:enoyl-CoA hydratase